MRECYREFHGHDLPEDFFDEENFFDDEKSNIDIFVDCRYVMNSEIVNYSFNWQAETCVFRGTLYIVHVNYDIYYHR